mgnify:CR=1 FL=1
MNDSVFYDDPCNTVLVEPACDVVTFLVDSEMTKTSSWKDND